MANQDNCCPKCKRRKAPVNECTCATKQEGKDADVEGKNDYVNKGLLTKIPNLFAEMSKLEDLVITQEFKENFAKALKDVSIIKLLKGAMSVENNTNDKMLKININLDSKSEEFRLAVAVWLMKFKAEFNRIKQESIGNLYSYNYPSPSFHFEERGNLLVTVKIADSLLYSQFVERLDNLKMLPGLELGQKQKPEQKQDNCVKEDETESVGYTFNRKSP